MRIPEEIELDLGLDDPQDERSLRKLAARKLGVDPERLADFVVLKRAIDARRGKVRFHVVLGAAPSGTEGQALACTARPPLEIDDHNRVAIIGSGPAGLFCAYELARHGIGSTVFDRGKPVQPRRRDLKALQQDGDVNPDSNYCFGEGGAGTYSDGKLYTRSHKRGDVRDVIELLAEHGAPDAILTDARPHIGSNKLPNVVTAMREHLEQVGVRFQFNARVETIERDPSGKVRAVRLADGSEFGAEAVVLAVGHSARDTLSGLVEAGVAVAPKGFAVGVRIEHPQPLINQIQYGKHAGHPALPSAAYRVSLTEDGRGVFSFCMCPGGFIVPAATEPGGVVVNGMSLSKRDSPFANSGLVVGIETEDLAAAGFHGPLAGIEYQRTLEQLAWQAGGGRGDAASVGGLSAPAARATDFIAGRASSTTSETSYQPGLTATDLGSMLDAAGVPIAHRLQRALQRFGQQMRGFVTEDAMLVGVETRTSCPLRVLRDPETLQSPTWAALYPCGEGAGYAGGIVSAAVDGVRVGQAIARALGSRD
jgi:uncharacterized FAD-dependent dehydrogenase